MQSAFSFTFSVSPAHVSLLHTQAAGTPLFPSFLPPPLCSQSLSISVLHWPYYSPAAAAVLENKVVRSLFSRVMTRLFYGRSKSRLCVCSYFGQKRQITTEEKVVVVVVVVSFLKLNIFFFLAWFGWVWCG